MAILESIEMKYGNTSSSVWGRVATEAPRVALMTGLTVHVRLGKLTFPVTTAEMCGSSVEATGKRIGDRWRQELYSGAFGRCFDWQLDYLQEPVKEVSGNEYWEMFAMLRGIRDQIHKQRGHGDVELTQEMANSMVAFVEQVEHKQSGR